MISGAQWTQVGMWRSVRAQRAAKERRSVRAWRHRGDTVERKRKWRNPRGEPEASSWRGEETLQIFGEAARSLTGRSGVSSGDVALCRCA